MQFGLGNSKEAADCFSYVLPKYDDYIEHWKQKKYMFNLYHEQVVSFNIHV